MLVAYLLVVLSAAVSLLKYPVTREGWKILIPGIAALAIGYTFWVNVYPVQSGAYGVIPWIVLGWCLIPLGVIFVKRSGSG